MIEYVEIRGADLHTIGIIDTATSIIWHSVYFGVGDFEIYAPATPEIVALLQIGYYVTRPNNAEVGIIESIDIATNEEDGKMITATGRFAKSILDRRLIYQLSGTSNTATILRGYVETAVREVVKNNAIDCPFDSKRNISVLMLGDLANISQKIVDSNGNTAQKQVSYGNLLEYTDEILTEYNLSAMCVLRGGKLQYKIYQGADRSVSNADGNTPIIFSQEFDNLTASEYSLNTTPEKNVALIGGEGEGVNRFYSLVEKSEADLQRREIWVDASSITKTYKNENDADKTYTDAEYKAMLDTQGMQSLALQIASETFDGTIDATNGNWVYGRDFALGDIVTVQDNDIGIYVNVRISEATEVQDVDGYTVDIKYQ